MKRHGPKSPDRSRRPFAHKTLAFESVEARQLMTITAADIVFPGAYEIEIPPGRLAEGSITYDGATHKVTIEGTDTHDDTVKIAIDNRGTISPLDDRLLLSLANINSPLGASFKPSDVFEIIFNGYGGNDFIDNTSFIKLR